MTAARSLYLAQQEIGGETCPPPYPAPPPHEEEQPAPVIRPHFERRTSGDHGYAPVPAEEVEREETPPSTSSSEIGTEASPKAPPPQRTRASASTSSAAAASSAAASAPARTGTKTRAAVVDISEVAPAPSGTANGKGKPRAKSKKIKKQELVGSSSPQTSSNMLPYQDTNNDPYFIKLYKLTFLSIVYIYI